MFKVCPNLNKSWATRFLAGPLRPTSRNCSSHLQRFGSTQGRSTSLQFVPVQISPANTRPACHFSTTSHPNSSVSHSANRQGPTTFYFFEPVCSSLSSGRTCKTIGIDCGGADDEDDQPCVTGVNDACDVETAGGTGSVVCSANLLSFIAISLC